MELESFAEDAPRKLRSLKGKLSQNSFKFAPAEGIPVPKLDAQGKKTGKFRPIVLASVESRIVQRAILNVLLDVPALQKYIKNPYSFGGIRKERREEGNTETLSAVPAAIKAVLSEIENGATYVASADIASFFTRISKDTVTRIISDAIKDEEMTSLFRQAIDVELSNMSQLREKSKDFPIENIGVAQGNSLSPLLGNIILSEFDRLMNEGDCSCIRYIDDFIILCPSKKAAGARLRKAIGILSDLGMTLSPEKSAKGGTPVDEGFDFLGISIVRGAIRPNEKAQFRILKTVQAAFDQSLKRMRATQKGQKFDQKYSLVSTLKKVDGIIDGWGKHYWFCNDKQIFLNIDQKIHTYTENYLNECNLIKKQTTRDIHQSILGISEIKSIQREPFAYPKKIK